MIKRIICFSFLCITSAFTQPQFFPTGGNNPQHVTVGGGTNSGTSLTAGPGIAINNGVISTNGSNSVTLSTFGFYTNIATNTIITNPNAYPYIVSIDLNQIGTIVNPGYAQITINSGGPANPPQVANYNTNQVTGFLNAMIPANATWFLSFQNNGGAAISSLSAFIYGTTPGTFAAGVIATPVSFANGGLNQSNANASAALTALGGASVSAGSYNAWLTNSTNVFPPVQYFTSSNPPSTAAVVTIANNASTATATGNLFANWPKLGASFANISSSQQSFVRTTNNPNTVTLTQPVSPGYSSASVQVYLPLLAFYDSIGNQQGYIGGGGMFGTSTGSFGQGTADGGYRFEDGIDSSRFSMAGIGGIFGEMLVWGTDINNGNPPWAMSPAAPNFSYILLPNGMNDFRVGITNDTGPVYIGGLIQQQAATNKPHGRFVLNGSTTVNVGNTLVTSTTEIHWNELLPNGGTATGQIIPVSITPNTGFAVKGIAGDTSICTYWLVNTN